MSIFKRNKITVPQNVYMKVLKLPYDAELFLKSWLSKIVYRLIQL